MRPEIQNLLNSAMDRIGKPYWATYRINERGIRKISFNERKIQESTQEELAAQYPYTRAVYTMLEHYIAEIKNGLQEIYYYTHYHKVLSEMRRQIKVYALKELNLPALNKYKEMKSRVLPTVHPKLPA